MVSLFYRVLHYMVFHPLLKELHQDLVFNPSYTPWLSPHFIPQSKVNQQFEISRFYETSFLLVIIFITFCQNFSIIGKRSFLWTDAVLSFIIFFGLLIVIFFGILDVPGGISQLTEKAQEQFWQEDIHISPHSYGSMMIGQFIIWLFIFSVYYGSGKDIM